jgi:hypothetical protein
MIPLHLPPGNLRVEVYDQLGGRLLGRAMLRIEPAPPDGEAQRARLEPDREFELEPGSHYYLRLPSAEGWQVELREGERAGSFAVVAPSTPMSAAVGGE